MKKLMIAAAVAMVGIAANAVTAIWGSDVYFNGEGSALATGANKIADGNHAYLFVIGVGKSYQDTWATYDTAAKIWDAVTISADGSSATLAGIDAAVGTANNGSILITGEEYANRDLIYALAVVTHVDANGNVDYYSANQIYAKAGTAGVTGTDTALINWSSPATSGTYPNVVVGDNTTWQSVPEPTSGLLLLLGVAGLALRRRRA